MIKYDELKNCVLKDLFSADELLEFASLIEIELDKMNRCVYQDYNLRKAVNERVSSLKSLKLDLSSMSDFLLKNSDSIGLRRKTKIDI